MIARCGTLPLKHTYLPGRYYDLVLDYKVDETDYCAVFVPLLLIELCSSTPMHSMFLIGLCIARVGSTKFEGTAVNSLLCSLGTPYGTLT